MSCVGTLATALTGVAITLFCTMRSADGHAFLMTPISRNYWFSDEFQDWPFEKLEYCPSCMNGMGPENVTKRAIENTPSDILDLYGGGELFPLFFAAEMGELNENNNYLEPEAIAARHGVCGDPRQNTYEGWNHYSTPNSEWPILQTYEAGSVIDVKIVMVAYHWGHFELNMCNTADLEDPDGVVTQECLNTYPLTRATDDDSNSPIDPDFPGRYYADPECRASETDQSEKPDSAKDDYYVMHMRYQLPEDLQDCERCVLQMIYFTGNGCKHIGYEEFEPSSWPSECAPDKEDWIELNRRVCGEEDTYPEEFWNCADIAITADGEPNPTPAPTSAIPECPEPVEPFEQCGGSSWTGSECCLSGYECTSHGDCYSDCRQIPNGCAEDWKQCGGVANSTYWEGPTCCWPGATCIEKTEYFSTCIPDDWEPTDDES